MCIIAKGVTRVELYLINYQVGGSDLYIYFVRLATFEPNPFSNSLSRRPALPHQLLFGEPPITSNLRSPILIFNCYPDETNIGPLPSSHLIRLLLAKSMTMYVLCRGRGHRDWYLGACLPHWLEFPVYRADRVSHSQCLHSYLINAWHSFYVIFDGYSQCRLVKTHVRGPMVCVDIDWSLSPFSAYCYQGVRLNWFWFGHDNSERF